MQPNEKNIKSNEQISRIGYRLYKQYMKRLYIVMSVALILLLVTNVLTFAIAARISHNHNKTTDTSLIIASGVDCLASTINETGLYIEMELPTQVTGEFKTYMDYKAITDKTSKQYGLQLLAETDSEGFRTFEGYYLVAMGTYYTDNVGDVFRITLDSGMILDVMIGDIKDNLHTDESNRFIEHNGNIIEFIVDSNVLAKTARDGGDISVLGFNGAIKSIEKRIIRY